MVIDGWHATHYLYRPDSCSRLKPSDCYPLLFAPDEIGQFNTRVELEMTAVYVDIVNGFPKKLLFGASEIVIIKNGTYKSCILLPVKLQELVICWTLNSKQSPREFKWHQTSRKNWSAYVSRLYLQRSFFSDISGTDHIFTWLLGSWFFSHSLTARQSL